MVDYEFLDFNLKDEIKNIKKYFSSSISEIEGKYEQLLNQSEENLAIKSSNTKVIDCAEFNPLFKGDWGLMLKEHGKYTLADEFYRKINNELMKIILRVN